MNPINLAHPEPIHSKKPKTSFSASASPQRRNPSKLAQFFHEAGFKQDSPQFTIQNLDTIFNEDYGKSNQRFQEFQNFKGLQSINLINDSKKDIFASPSPSTYSLIDQYQSSRKNNFMGLGHTPNLSLGGICQDLYNKQSESIVQEKTLTSGFPSFQKASSYKALGMKGNSQSNSPVKRKGNSSSISILRTKDDFPEAKKFSVIKEVIAKPRNTPARTFTFTLNQGIKPIKQEMLKPLTPFIKTRGESFSREKQPKLSILNVVQSRVFESVNELFESPKRISTAVDFGSILSLRAVTSMQNNNKQTRSAAELGRRSLMVDSSGKMRIFGGSQKKLLKVVPVKEAPFIKLDTDFTTGNGMDSVNEVVNSGGLVNNKKFTAQDMRVARGYNNNGYLIRIENEALKELKLRRRKKMEETVKKRAVVVEDFDHSPLQLKPEQGGNNPLFAMDTFEDNEIYQAFKKIKNRNWKEHRRIIMAVLRRRFIKCLNMMKRLKLTPKALLKGDKIFSVKPFEKEGSRELLAAVKAGDLSKVKLILDKENRYLVYDFDNIHQTALHWAVKKGHSEIVEALIQRGADVNARDIAHRTPLYIALKYNQMQVLKILLANQADAWSTKDCNYTELAKDNLMAKLYITKARQLWILLKMTPANQRDEIWKVEGDRMITNLRTNIALIN